MERGRNARTTHVARVTSLPYEPSHVIHDAHEEAPKDHLAINLRAAIVKAREYYNKFDLSPAYYAATILHPRYKYYCDVA
jgi:hypothetical protein